MLNGGAMAYVMRQIIYGENIQSGRIIIPLDTLGDTLKK
jgi:hypothetical protein